MNIFLNQKKNSDHKKKTTTKHVVICARGFIGIAPCIDFGSIGSYPLYQRDDRGGFVQQGNYSTLYPRHQRNPSPPTDVRNVCNNYAEEVRNELSLLKSSICTNIHVFGSVCTVHSAPCVSGEERKKRTQFFDKKACAGSIKTRNTIV